MRLRLNLTPRQYLIVAHDVLATAVAIVLTFVMRFEGPVLASKLEGLELFLPFFLVYAAAVYYYAVVGDPPEGFDKHLIRDAFSRKTETL